MSTEAIQKLEAEIESVSVDQYAYLLRHTRNEGRLSDEAYYELLELPLAELRALYEKHEDFLWEIAKSEDHEAWDEANGTIAGLERAIAILREEVASDET